MVDISIEGRRVGPGHPCFVIAELGVNHNGNLDLAFQLVDAAIGAGVDAVKFQTFKAERLAMPLAPKARYQMQTTDKEETQIQMLSNLEFSKEAHLELQEYCRRKKILFLSTPFDEESADFLDEIGVPAFKISSGDLNNWPFLTHLAKKGKPLLLSTGMSDLEEVKKASEAVFKTGNSHLALLHCVSNYPADPADVNLKAIRTLMDATGLPVGYSDHTMGIEVSLAAVALGACVIEKHFTLSRAMAGPDHKASLEPRDFAALTAGIRNIEKAFGNGVKAPAASEQENRRIVRKSLVAACDIAVDTALSQTMFIALRPGDGIAPSELEKILARKAKKSIKRGEQLSWEHLQ